MAGTCEAGMPSLSLQGCIHGGPRDALPIRDLGHNHRNFQTDERREMGLAARDFKNCIPPPPAALVFRCLQHQ